MEVYRALADRAARFRQSVTAERAAVAALLLLGCLPAVLVWIAIAGNRIPLPHWDEWFTPGRILYEWCNGTFGLDDLFVQHNESRKVFPNLLYLLLAQAHGWDVRDAMTLVFTEVCALSVLLLLLLRTSGRGLAVPVVATWVVMTFLCFSPAQFENFLWGIQLETFFPGVAVAAAALVNLSALSLRVRTFCNLLLALVATYTYANGMLLWVLALPLPDRQASRRATISCYAAYLLAGFAAVAAYFHGYERPEDLPAFALAGRHPGDLAHYVILWIGAYFRSDGVSAFAAGTCAVALGTVTFSAAALAVVRSRDWRPFYPWFLLGAYAAASCGLIAVGRLPLGVEHAMDARYTAFSLFYYLSVAGCCLALYATAVRNPVPARDFFLKGAGRALAGVALMGWIACYQEGVRKLELRRAERIALTYTLEWIDVIPDNADIRAIFPMPQWLYDSIPVLRNCGVLRLPFAGEPLASAVAKPPGETDGSHGGIDECRFDAQGNLAISGWAWLPGQNRPADRVIVGCEDATGAFRPISVLGTGESRPDLRDHFQRPNMIRAGFARTMNAANLPPGPLTVTAWAIDLRKQRAHPLGGRHSPRREQVP